MRGLRGPRKAGSGDIAAREALDVHDLGLGCGGGGVRESKDVRANLDELSVVQPLDLADVQASAEGCTELRDP